MKKTTWNLGALSSMGLNHTAKSITRYVILTSHITFLGLDLLIQKKGATKHKRLNAHSCLTDSQVWKETDNSPQNKNTNMPVLAIIRVYTVL